MRAVRLTRSPSSHTSLRPTGLALALALSLLLAGCLNSGADLQRLQEVSEGQTAPPGSTLEKTVEVEGGIDDDRVTRTFRTSITANELEAFYGEQLGVPEGRWVNVTSATRSALWERRDEGYSIAVRFNAEDVVNGTITRFFVTVEELKGGN